MTRNQTLLGLALTIFCGTVFSQVTSLQCMGTMHLPKAVAGGQFQPGASDISGVLIIDSDREVFRGSLLSFPSMAGIPVLEVPIQAATTASYSGKRIYSTGSGATHALHVSVDRTTGKVVLFEFPEGQKTAFGGFSVITECKVARPLF